MKGRGLVCGEPERGSIYTSRLPSIKRDRELEICRYVLDLSPVPRLCRERVVALKPVWSSSPDLSPEYSGRSFQKSIHRSYFTKMAWHMKNLYGAPAAPDGREMKVDEDAGRYSAA